jgi:nitrite transporter NirC
MGSTFGLALTLVIFAGAELFTGNNMVCAVGALSRLVTWATVGRIFAVSFLGNLMGSLLLAWLVAQSGLLSQGAAYELVMKAATAKMALSGWELFIRGILCNWLVCLAVWTAARTTSDAAKLVLIFWCLLAFVGSGFEHSIANQSLLGMALLLPHPDSVNCTGFVMNQAYVVLGNVIGGSVFVGGLYWLASFPLSSAVVPAGWQPAAAAVESEQEHA